ncbi:MAG: glycosyltransferase family 4 protein, partial [Syntrophales bacterium LBB04]|nr:glycosyltransferase family 4 protein [Syntrophales bacterium LBB04]
DLVHVHAIGPSLFSIFPRLKGIPAVVQAHGLEWKRDKWGILGKTFFRLSDLTAVYFPNRLTAVSRVQKEYFEQKYGREVVYIPTGVNRVNRREPRWLLQLDLEPQKYILFAARLVEEKGAHFLIDAYKHLGGTDFKLVIAGDAANEWRYKNLLSEICGRDPRIVMTGFVTGEPLEELFSNAYLFCLPSTVEGLPIALLEAMSYGNCCVASDIPESLEAMGEHGYTFKNRDSKDLYEVLRRLIDNPHLVEQKKAAAREHVLSNYSWDKVADEMERLYLSLVRNGNNAGH